MSNVVPPSDKTALYGNWLMTLAAAISFILILIFYFTPHGPIAHSWGALLVVVSTGLMVMAGLLIGLATLPRWLVILFEVLLILDIIGTGVCAYFLEANSLLALMVVSLIGWIARLSWHSRISGAEQPWVASPNPR